MTANVGAMPIRDPSRRKMRTHIGVKRSDPQVARDRADHVLQARLHLAGRLVRKGYRKNAIRRDAHLTQKLSDAVRQDSSFSTAGPGKNQNRAIGLPNGGRLHVVEDFRFQEHL